MDRTINKQLATRGILTEDELISRVESGEIKYVRVLYSVFSKTCSKIFDAEFFCKDVLNKSSKIATFSLYANIENTPINSKSFTVELGVPDVHVEIDKSTFRIMSWIGKEYVVCIANIKDINNNEMHLCSPRNVLIKTLKNSKESFNINFQAGTEIEFYLFNNSNIEITKNYPEINLEKFKISEKNDYLNSSILSKNQLIINKILENVKDCGIKLEGLLNESGPGQKELNMGYGEVINNCDNHLLIKQCINQTAHDNKFGCSFMAKPFIDKCGSSSHVHISAYKEGVNLFMGTDYKIQNTFNNKNITCSIKMIHFIGGILKYLQEFFILYAPTINSYKRFRKNSFAPFFINTWGYDKRNATVRVIGENETLHIEVRLAGADANPYNVLTAIIASGIKGIENEIMPPEIETGKIYEKNINEFVSAPKNLLEAIGFFQKSKFANEIFGEDFKDLILTHAYAELDAYENHISNWEINRYLDSA